MKKLFFLLSLLLVSGCATQPPFTAGDYVTPRDGSVFQEGLTKIQLLRTPDTDSILVGGKEWKLADLKLAELDPVTPNEPAATVKQVEPDKKEVAAKPPEAKPQVNEEVVIVPPAEMPKPAAVAPAEAKAEEKTEEKTEVKTEPDKVTHAGIGAEVKVSSENSTFPDEKPAAALVDGDLTTRWSSAYSEPQTIELKLAKPMKIAKLRLHWENAAASKYAIAVSKNAKDWNAMYAYMKADAKARARIDEVKMNNVQTQHIKIDLTSRASQEWGFSLYEIEVIPAD